MFEASFSARKNWTAVAFVLAYLLPLTLLFTHRVVLKAVARQAWGELLAMSLMFAPPLAALWAAAWAYPTFRKGAPAFPGPAWRRRTLVFFLAQGALICFACIAYPVLFILKLATFPHEPFILGVALIVGLIGLPAAVFACGVLLKQLKESGRTR